MGAFGPLASPLRALFQENDRAFCNNQEGPAAAPRRETELSQHRSSSQSAAVRFASPRVAGGMLVMRVMVKERRQ